MRIFKIVHFNLPKKEMPVETIARYAPVVAKYSSNPCDLKFFLQDSASHKISHIDRAIKKNPPLSVFRYIDNRFEDKGVRPTTAISNFDTHWMGFEDTPRGSFHDTESIYEILSGIPKRYAIENAIVIYDHINFLDGEQKLNSEPGMQARKPTPPYFRYFLSSSIIHKDIGWQTGRIRTLKAIIEIPEYSDISDYTKSILDSICSDYRIETVVAPEPCEVENTRDIDRKASALISTFFKDFPTRSKDIIGDLELKDPWEKPFDWNQVSQKASLKNTFAKHNFKFEKTIPGHNIIPLSSKTSLGNRVLIEFVFSNTYRNFQMNITFQGKYWINSTHFKIFPGSLTINDQQTMDRVMLGALKSWQVVESELIPTLDGLYGKPPAWLFDEVTKKPKKATKA